jgi:endonuclease YncB( thermonuclease family)
MPRRHDFNRFPELTTRQMETLYFESPHKQITEDFRAKVVKVTDGDTIRVETNFRDFSFPIRFLDIDAPETNEVGGKASKTWLEEQILNQEIDVKITQNRVDKFGRLLGHVEVAGLDMGEASLRQGFSVEFNRRADGELPELGEIFNDA